jgi:hypothetical protein
MRKFFILDRNLLVEYIYENSTTLNGDDQIIIDHRLPNFKSFANDSASSNGNTIDRSLTVFNSDSNQWTPISELNPRLVIQEFPSPVPVTYDTIRIHLPISYAFEDVVGLAMTVSSLDRNNTPVYLSTWYYDKIEHNSPLIEEPFILSEKYWGKYFELKIPSIQEISAQRVNNGSNSIVQPGSLNARLSDVGLSTSSPIFISLSYIRRRRNIGQVLVYELGVTYDAVAPSGEQYLNLGVGINESTEGDWFVISGLLDNTIGGFSQFLSRREIEGLVDTLSYEISIIEGGTVTSRESRFLIENLDTPIEFRPIIKNTSTIAMIDVIMRLRNEADNSVIERRGSFTLSGSQLSKYGKSLSKIDLEGILSPIVYVNQSSNNQNIKIDGNLVMNSGTIYYPVLIERKNFVLKNRDIVSEGDTFYGIGAGNIVVYPFDNVFKVIIAEEIADNGAIQYYSVPTDAQPVMLFKSDTTIVELPLWTDSREIDLSNGSLVFKADAAATKAIHQIYYTGFPYFYIVLDTIGNTRSVLYSGRVILFESPEFRNRLS